MIKGKPITQNPERYNIKSDSWVVSASPNIKPLEFNFGKPLDNLKPVLQADGLIINTGGAYLLCSQNTIDIIKGMNNPHYDILVNGSVMVKDREVKLGKTIPVINIDLLKLPSMGESRKVSNDKAGVSSVSYIYEGEEVMGVPKGIIDQLNYTLVDSIDRPGDTFSYYKWIKEDDIKYGIEKLKIDTAQEDGTLDKKKLASFIKGIDERLRALRSDFKSIKRTFFFGETPAASGIQLISVKNYSVKPEDDIIEHQYVEKETIAISLVQSATQTAASSSVAKVEDTKKSLTDKIDKTSTTLQKQLEQEQVKDSIQQQQIRNDLQAQITANDAYYREKYGSPTK